MRHWSLLLLVGLLSLPKQAPNQHAPHQQVSKEQTNQPKDAKKTSDTSSESAPIINFYTNNAEQEHNSETAKIIFDGLLVVATFGLIWVGLRQAKILHKHEEWMEKHDTKLEKLAQAADANAIAAQTSSATAKESFQSVIDSERAWVVADSPRIESGKQQATSVFCAVRNRGKTMARVIEKGENYSIRAAPDGLPAIPDYGITAKWPDGLTLPPASESVLTRRINILSDAHAWNQVMNGSLVLLLFGFVKYRDVFDREHETRYIFRFDNAWGRNEFYVEYKDEYSRAT